MRIIRDGLDAGSTGQSGKIRENIWAIQIGNNPNSTATTSNSWDGKIDEVRISTVDRSIDWMRAEYRNQGSPATYQSLQNEKSRFLGGAILTEAHFDSDDEGFVFLPDIFRSTSAAAYASGDYIAAGGYAGGALRVVLGGINDNIISGMSGGWRQTFTLAAKSKVSISFVYKLTMGQEYEPDEWSQALVSVDGTLYGEGGGENVAQINGDSPVSTGWHRFHIDLGTLTAGTHTLIIGGYNNKKTFNDESTEIIIDDVIIRQ